VPSSNVSQLSAPLLDVPSPDAPQRDVLSFNVPSGDSGPSLAEVRAMALRHLGLEASRARSLRERAASRGWAPRVDIHLDYGEGRDRSRDYDEAFLSGETRFLFDRDEDHSRDWDVGLVLRWDLGNARFDPEELDAAREERQWIALRDDVLDELVQLYFERQRKLLEAARVAAGPGDTRAQVAQLRLRARELAAGLDSWTGDGFSRALASRRSVSGAVGGSEAK
jgi:hypothetical protein